MPKEYGDYHSIGLVNYPPPKGSGFSAKLLYKDAREHLKNTKRCRASYNGRLFIAQKDDSIYLYYYGRDVEYLSLDYWWIFKKRKHPKVL